MIYKPSKKIFGKVQQGDVLKELTTQGSQPADRWYSPEGGDSSTVTSIQGKNNKINVGDKKTQISAKFGSAGMVTSVAVVLALAGGTTAVVLTNPPNPVTIAEVVGIWTHGGQNIFTGGVAAHMDPVALRVTPAGSFTLTTALEMTVGTGAGISGQSGNSQKIGEKLDCSGIVSADGGQFSFASTGGSCNDFTAELSPDHRTLVVGSFENNDGSLSLSRSK